MRKDTNPMQTLSQRGQPSRLRRPRSTRTHRTHLRRRHRPHPRRLAGPARGPEKTLGTRSWAPPPRAVLTRARKSSNLRPACIPGHRIQTAHRTRHPPDPSAHATHAGGPRPPSRYGRPLLPPDQMAGIHLDTQEPIAEDRNVQFGRHLVQQGNVVVCTEAFPFNTVPEPQTTEAFPGGRPPQTNCSKTIPTGPASPNSSGTPAGPSTSCWTSPTSTGNGSASWDTPWAEKSPSTPARSTNAFRPSSPPTSAWGSASPTGMTPGTWATRSTAPTSPLPTTTSWPCTPPVLLPLRRRSGPPCNLAVHQRSQKSLRPLRQRGRRRLLRPRLRPPPHR